MFLLALTTLWCTVIFTTLVANGHSTAYLEQQNELFRLIRRRDEEEGKIHNLIRASIPNGAKNKKGESPEDTSSD